MDPNLPLNTLIELVRAKVLVVKQDDDIWLPASECMRKARAAGLAGRTEIDDRLALEEMAYLVLKGEGLKPASRKAATLALNDAGASEASVAHRLRTKFARDTSHLWIAEIRLYGELFSAAAKFAALESGRLLPDQLVPDSEARRVLRAAGDEARIRTQAAVEQTVKRLTRAGRKLA
jgi:hypothetical protein